MKSILHTFFELILTFNFWLDECNKPIKERGAFTFHITWSILLLVVVKVTPYGRALFALKVKSSSEQIYVS